MKKTSTAKTIGVVLGIMFFFIGIGCLFAFLIRNGILVYKRFGFFIADAFIFDMLQTCLLGIGIFGFAVGGTLVYALWE